MARSRSNAAHSAQSSKHEVDDAFVKDLERRSAQLEAENRKLEQFARYRSVFLARLTHELRTPLTSILGFAEILLSQEKLSEPQRGFCERIQNSAQQLQNSLNQLADLSRLESGKADMRCEEFAIHDLLVESCQAIARQARKQTVKVRLHAASDLPLLVSDPTKLRQVMHSLLGYAIARSPTGATVSTTGDKAMSGKDGFVLTIEDEGELLSSSALTVDLDSINSRSGSSDLGLAIAKHNLSLLGASLSFENRQPHGLKMVIALPANPPNQPA